MRTRYRISVGGVQMDTLDNDIYILDISHSEPEIETNESRVANLGGYEPTDEYFAKTIVTVTFELHIYDIAKRNEVCQKVNAWAKAGGTLVVQDRSKQRLWYTRCEKFASIASAKNWTDPLTLVFATTYLPYWISDTAKTLSLSGKSAKGTLKMDGNNGNAPVSVEATANAKVTSFKVTVGDTNIELKGLSLTNGQTLVIDYLRNRYLRIRADGKSVMNLLQPKSSDRLLAPCGANTTVNISADNKVTATVTARGQWI